MKLTPLTPVINGWLIEELPESHHTGRGVCRYGVYRVTSRAKILSYATDSWTDAAYWLAWAAAADSTKPGSISGTVARKVRGYHRAIRACSPGFHQELYKAKIKAFQAR